MAERTTQTPITNRAGVVTGYTNTTSTVKKGTSDTARKPKNNAPFKRLQGSGRNRRPGGPGGYSLLMDPWSLKIKKVK